MAENICLKAPLIQQILVRIFPCRGTWISAFIIFFTPLLAWSVSHAIPALRTIFLILAPQLWQGGTQWLTQPVLFLLVNCVILSIWLRGRGQQDEYNAAASKQETELKPNSISLVAAALPDDPIMRLSSSGLVHISEVLPVSDDRRLSLISNAKNERLDSPLCSNCIADDQVEELRSIADVEIANGAVYDIGKIKRMSRQMSAPEKRNGRIPRLRSDARATAAAVNSAEAQSTEREELEILEKRCPSFPQNYSSTVIVRDMSESEGMMEEETVINGDELNTRIEAFFTKFRQQLQLQRQESLRRRDQHRY